MYNVKKIPTCAILVAIAYLTSKIEVFNFLFPNGGSITFFSMLFLSLPGYFFGFKYGLISCLVFSMLKFITGIFIYSPLQGIIDYVLSFLPFAITGLIVFSNNKNGFVIGYIIAVVFRLILSVVSGVLFFSDYAPENTPSLAYSFMYNASYIVPEAVVTIVILETDLAKKYLLLIKNKINIVNKKDD